MTSRVPRTFRAAAAATAVMAVVVGFGSQHSDAPPSSSPGAAGSVVVPAAPLATAGATTSTITVQLPTGRLTVSATDPTADVPAKAAADGRSHEAGAGRRYVGVDWGFVVGDGVPTWAGPLGDGDSVEVSLGLQTSGDDYDLGVAARDAATPSDARTSGGYVLVDGDASSADLTVTFDGVTQVVDLRSGHRTSGPDTGLTELSDGTPESEDCGPTVLPAGTSAAGGDGGVACGWWHRTLPWVSGLGWADPSDPGAQGWVVAEVGTQGRSWSRGGSSWLVDDITDDQTGAARSVSVQADPTALASIYVLPPGSTSVPVSRTVTGTLQSGTGSTRGTLRLAGDLPVS